MLRKKQSLSWSSLNPEERNAFTASQLNVQNQRVRQDLHLIEKGIEDEKRCENATHAKEELSLHNRYNRLSKVSERLEKRATDSLTSFELGLSQLRNKNLRDRSTSESPRSSYRPETPTEDRKVRFFKEAAEAGHLPPLKTKEELIPKEVLARRGGADSRRSSFMESDASMRERSLPNSRESYDTLHGSGRRGTLPSSFAYYDTPFMSLMATRSSRGFSVNASIMSQHSSERNFTQGSSADERWRTRYQTRELNARLKALRMRGRRLHTDFMLQELMDDNVKIRKRMTLAPGRFTPDKAWQMLNCRYLRLTPSNVKTLEKLCGDAGYDVSYHPHVVIKDAGKEIDTSIQDCNFNDQQPISLRK